MRKFYYCKNCGFVCDISNECRACADTNQIYLGDFVSIDEAYVYYMVHIYKS